MLKLLVSLVGLLFRSHTGLLAENMALRHQLSVLQRTARRPRLKAGDRVFWVWLSRIWPQWRSSLLIVRPKTVITWHRQGFRLYWRWKSRAGKPGACACTRSCTRLRVRSSELPGGQVAQGAVGTFPIVMPTPRLNLQAGVVQRQEPVLVEAFTRRLRYVIEFPLPGQSEREKLWRNGFPKSVDPRVDPEIRELIRHMSGST